MLQVRMRGQRCSKSTYHSLWQGQQDEVGNLPDSSLLRRQGEEGTSSCLPGDRQTDRLGPSQLFMYQLCLGGCGPKVGVL